MRQRRFKAGAWRDRAAAQMPPWERWLIDVLYQPLHFWYRNRPQAFEDPFRWILVFEFVVRCDRLSDWLLERHRVPRIPMPPTPVDPGASWR